VLNVGILWTIGIVVLIIGVKIMLIRRGVVDLRLCGWSDRHLFWLA